MNATLEMLGLSVPLNFLQSYHDDGFVKNVVDYLEQLRGYDPEKPLSPAQLFQRSIDTQRLRNSLGITITVQKPCVSWFRRLEKEEVHLAYLRHTNAMVEIYVRGQQETDALRELGQLDALEKIIEARYGLSFAGLARQEVIDIGGVHSLLRKHSAPEIYRFGNNNQMLRALSKINRASIKSGYGELSRIESH
ncbi:MAG TPA: hypothetical protein VJA18_05625 [Candidatus Nanoarchaeia archaeon]|nr:hypothetical protein [Candidatus Nanoarchaeia archaeon]